MAESEWEPTLILPQVVLGNCKRDERTQSFVLRIDMPDDNIGTMNAAVLMTMFHKNAEIRIKVEE